MDCLNSVPFEWQIILSADCGHCGEDWGLETHFTGHFHCTEFSIKVKCIECQLD